MLRIIGVLIASLLILSAPVYAEPEENEGEELKRWEQDMDRQAHSIELQKRQFELEKQRTRLEHSKKQFRAQNKNWKPDLSKKNNRDKGDDRRHGKWGGKYKKCPFFGKILVLILVINISLFIIVLKDMKSDRNNLSGLWALVVLLGSIPAAVAYALFRLISQRDN